MIKEIKQLAETIDGEFYTDKLHKLIYATDASVYRKIPLAVCTPKNNEDIKRLVKFANENNVSLIPRTAGTSLAGQCVGDGIIVDTSKHFNKIISLDKELKQVTVQPGIIRDELNNYLKDSKLFFAPNTSTSNRCMIGGMVGNNSSGTTSIKYGVTRDKIINLKTILSDTSEVHFEKINNLEFKNKTKTDTLEGEIYRTIYNELRKIEVQKEIKKQFPKNTIHRRNNGYAIDALLKSKLFGGNEDTISLTDILSGSEGTLGFTTEITLQLDDLPPAHNVMVAAHFTTIQESMEAVVTAMKHNLYLCELMDKTILDCTKNNREQLKNRKFVEGDPEAILMLEVCADTPEKAKLQAIKLIADLKTNSFGYAYPILIGPEINKAITLRKAGLGLLGNIIGDDKAVACIEDTAVEVEDLPNYIREFTQMMDDYNQKAVYYAHAGAGEIHLRPILNLKKAKDVNLFREITTKTAELVKKYGGAFSGEHGDGIVRAEFIPLMIGDKNYELIKKIKYTFDPNNILNRGKIVDPFKMDEALRFKKDRKEPLINSFYDYSDSKGILRATEKCNGSGDCRKLPEAGGTMCPSYRATKNEKDTTRARANTLREILTNSEKENKFDSEELKEVFDLCLSCKACASECPSNVDIATLKSEFLYQYHKKHKPSFRDKLFGLNSKYNKIGMLAPSITNSILNLNITKQILGIPVKRSIPKLHKQTLKNWYAKNYEKNNATDKVYLFCDEFTNYQDVEIGKDCIKLLNNLGFEVLIIKHEESGRTMISKGFLDEFKIVANKNIEIFKNLISEKTPLIGIDPSAILSFRDEYLRTVDDKESAKKIAKNTLTIEEFICNLIASKKIEQSIFTEETKTIKIHGHCQQKSLIGTEPTFKMLNLPLNYKVSIITSGCCGMAGSFGFEKEHYDISMQVGEDTLFPKIRNTTTETIIAAAGTSCRHQLIDGVQRKSFHPATILLNALK